MKKLALIGNALAGASLAATAACGPGEQTVSAPTDYHATDLQYLPVARFSDPTNDCEVDMRYIINPSTGKIIKITDPRLYEKSAEYNDFCPPDTFFAPHSDAVHYPEADRKAYYAFQAKATERLDRATWPRNAGDEHFAFPATPQAAVAIGHVVLTEDKKALQAQLFNGAGNTPISATKCFILPSLHGKDGSLADSNRTLGNVMYRGKTDVPYTLVQLGADAGLIPESNEPPMLNGYCEAGTIVAVRAATPVSS